jgi:hypothetical protein
MDALLKPAFAATHITALLTHHQAMIKEFQQGAWEESIGKGGKFIEAVLKALWIHTGNTLPPARQFKADTVINQLANQSTFDDSVRLTIPRASRFAYDIASNRGARHDPTEIDPNEMDANAVVGVTSWILGELVRYAQKGTLKPDEVKALVDGLAEKKYPLMEEVEGRTYFHVAGASARDIALLLLWQRHPKRFDRPLLEAAVARHGFTKKNAALAVDRLRGAIDVDVSGLRLLQPGIREAEALLAKAQMDAASGKKVPRRRKRRRRTVAGGVVVPASAATKP